MMQANRWNRWEWCLYRVDTKERQREGRSYWLAFDRDHLADMGCLGRLVIAGWAVEVFKPMKDADRPSLTQ